MNALSQATTTFVEAPTTYVVLQHRDVYITPWMWGPVVGVIVITVVAGVIFLTPRLARKYPD